MKTTKSGKLIITSYVNQKFHTEPKTQFVACFIVDNRLEYVKVIPDDEKILPGTILTAKVQNVVKNIPAAFLSLNQSGDIGFLPLKDKSFKSGEEVLVQVLREPMKTKEYTLTEQLSLSSNYTVATVGSGKLLFSQKLSPKKKEFILDYLVSKAIVTRDKTLIGISDFDITVRTDVNTLFVPGNFDISPLIADIKDISDSLRNLIEKSKMRTCYTVHHKPIHWISEIWSELKACGFEIEEYVTDHLEIKTKLSSIIPKEHLDQIRLYQDNQIPLSSLYGLQSKLNEVTSKRVWLKSGAYLIIEPTEAMTVIDINSGKNIKKSDNEQLYFDVNMEAAEEIARQIRLRNLSGIVIIDFINMQNEEMEVALLEHIKQCCKSDFSKVFIYNFTQLGLLELTRAKKSKALHELL